MSNDPRAFRSRLPLFAAILGTVITLPLHAAAAGDLPTAVAQRATVQQERSYDGTVEAERRSRRLDLLLRRALGDEEVRRVTARL